MAFSLKGSLKVWKTKNWEKCLQIFISVCRNLVFIFIFVIFCNFLQFTAEIIYVAHLSANCDFQRGKAILSNISSANQIPLVSIRVYKDRQRNTHCDSEAI